MTVITFEEPKEMPQIMLSPHKHEWKVGLKQYDYEDFECGVYCYALGRDDKTQFPICKAELPEEEANHRLNAFDEPIDYK